MKRAAVGAAIVAFGLTGVAKAHDFVITADQGQTRQIEASLAACPSLAKTLDALVKTNGFRGIRVAPAQTRTGGPFLAGIDTNEIVVAADWLALQAQPFSDVRHPGKILPDNLCFDLGHLAHHIAVPAPSLMQASRPDAFVTMMTHYEARAFLRGWPFVLEAARLKNGDKPLTGAQIGGLMVNLRYRFAFLLALNDKANPKLSVLDDGAIPETDANVAAIASALLNAQIADLQ